MTAPDRVDWLALARVLDGADSPDELAGETALEYERIQATGPIEDAEPVDTTLDEAAEAFWSEVNDYVAAVADDLEAQGIDPNSPESHEYFVAIEAMR